MNRVATAVVTAVAAVALCASACGVGSEDEPQLIEESTQPPPSATPSFDTEKSPTVRPTTTTPDPSNSQPSG